MSIVAISEFGKMASRFVKSPVVQTTAKRQFGAQAVAKTEHVVAKPEGLKVSTLKNGLTVASIETNGPTTTLGVVVRAGSRNETYENAGVAHMLRISAGLATKNNSAFGLTRNLQQAGSGLVCTQGREHTLYSVQVNIELINTFNLCKYVNIFNASNFVSQNV